MDRLDSLPESPSQISPQEGQIIAQYFNTPQGDKKEGEKVPYKKLLYVTGLYVLLSNTVIDNILCNIHMLCMNPIVRLFVKTMLFAVGYWAIDRYL